MPDFLAPQFVRFELNDGTPVVRLSVPPPEPPDTWRLLSRATLCVVDGPGDAGYLIPRAGMDVPAGWDDAVERIAGALIVFGDGPGAHQTFAPSLDEA